MASDHAGRGSYLVSTRRHQVNPGFAQRPRTPSWTIPEHLGAPGGNPVNPGKIPQRALHQAVPYSAGDPPSAVWA